MAVDETALTDYKASLEADETFVKPEELFFWMSPTFTDGHEMGYMYPVKRQRILAGKLFDEGGNPSGLSQSVTIDLARIVNDWNFGWLSQDNVDGDPEELNQNDINGFYLFMADGYSRYDNYDYYYDDGSYDENYYMRGLAGSSEDFNFSNSRPSGQGYSNVVEQIGDDYRPFTLLGSGLYVEQEQVLGGEPLMITLQMDEYQSWAGQIEVSGWIDSFILDNSNNYDAESDEDTMVWYVVFEAPGTGYDTPVYDDPDFPVISGTGYYHVGAERDQDFNLWWNNGWQSAWFRYGGYPSVFLATDFDGNNIGVSGIFGTGETDIVKSTDYNYDLGAVPLNEYNNWKIGSIEPIEHQYEGYISESKVLGISATENLSDWYDWGRHDIVTFPGYNYADGVYVSVSFKARPEMDWSWYDEVVVEFENDYGGWDWIGSFSGGIESWELQEDNGWSTFVFEAYTGLTEDDQQVRLRFYSNSWDENTGILIDDFRVMELQ